MAADSHRQWQHFTATDSSGVSQPTAELRLARAWALAQGNPAPFPSHDVMGNRVITLPKQWPLARPQLATREERLQRAELRLAFAWALQREQHANQLPLLPPCSSHFVQKNTCLQLQQKTCCLWKHVFCYSKIAWDWPWI